MPNWIHVETQKIFSNLGEIKRANPNTSFPPGPISVEFLKNLGYEVIDTSARPLPSSDLKIVRIDGAKQREDKTWYVTYKEVNRHSTTKHPDGSILKTKAQQDKDYLENIKMIKLGRIRDQRNSLLSQADLEISKGLDNEEDVMPWRKYRKALREMMDNLKDPDKVVWPQPPK